MRNSKHGLKSLVLAIMAALGMMAFTAGAQAQTHTELLHSHALTNASQNPNPLTKPGETNTPGTFLINLAVVPKELGAKVVARQISKEGVLLVVERSLEVRCTALTLTEAKIESGTDAKGGAIFTGCKAFDHKTLELLANCVLKQLETIEAKALVLPILHGGENFLLFEPQVEGENFTTISFKPGMGCVLPLNNPVNGSVSALVDALDAVKQLILFSEGIQLLTGDELRFGGFRSYINTHGEVELTGEPHTDQKLGIH